MTMPEIYTAAECGDWIVQNPDAGAQVGRWCRAPEEPDRCYTCFEPLTLAHYPATGYIERDGWRYGTCARCTPA
jgi:hypothetical protein